MRGTCGATYTLWGAVFQCSKSKGHERGPGKNARQHLSSVRRTPLGRMLVLWPHYAFSEPAK